MIVGTGIDIAEVPRIAQALARYGNRFLHRVFTEGEIRYCDSKANRVERYAARFAAKEAGMKALCTGWNHGVRWRDIEVSRQPGGQPTITFHGKAAEFAARLGAVHVALSLSHTAEQAIAPVMLVLVLGIPVWLDMSKANFRRLTALYLPPAFPFFITGLECCMVFARGARHVSRLSGADLPGAAWGCVAIGPLLNWPGGTN